MFCLQLGGVVLFVFLNSALCFFWCPQQQLGEKLSLCRKCLGSEFSQLQQKYSNVLRYLVSKNRLCFEPFKRDLAAEQDVLPQGKRTWWNRNTAQFCGKKSSHFWKKSTCSSHIAANQTEAFMSQSFHTGNYFMKFHAHDGWMASCIYTTISAVYHSLLKMM